MSILFTQMSSKGQVVIPAELRQELGLENGTQLSVERHDGAILLRPITAAFVRSLRGSARGAGAVREREHRKDR